MERSREASGGRERRRERSEERAGGGRSQERRRGDSRDMERGSLRREDGSRSREAERGNLGRCDQRDPRGDSRDPRGNSRDSRGDSRRQEWGRGGTESRDRSSSSVSTKVESGVGEKKEVWEAPMPGEWQATEESGVPSWDRTVLKEEENPPDWVEPPQPKVDLRLSPYKEEFKAETTFPPVTSIENKEELLRADDIPEDDPVVVEFARGYVRTTRRGLRKSKFDREEEEREVYQMLTERGFFGGRGRGGRGRGGRGRGGSQRGRGDDQGGVNPNMEPVAGSRGFGGRMDRRDGGQEGDRRSRDRGHGGADRSSRQERDGNRGNSSDGRTGERSGDRHRDAGGENRSRHEERPRERERHDPRRAGSGSNEARRGEERGHVGSGGRAEGDGRGDCSGRMQDVKQEAGPGSVSNSRGSKPKEALSYKEWKEQQQKRKSAGQ